MATPVLEAGRILTRQSITEQITEQQFSFKKDIDFSIGAITPRVTRESHGRLDETHQYSSEVINCELAASQAFEVGNGRVSVETDATSSFSRQ